MSLTILNCTQCQKDFLVSDNWLPIKPNTPGYRIEVDEKDYITTRCQQCFFINSELTDAEKLEDPNTGELTECQKP